MKQGILLAAFGTSNPRAHHVLDELDERVRAAFPGLPVRWAFTSAIIRSRLADEGMKTDSVTKALRKMWFEKYRAVAVQSLHVVPGAEFEALEADAMAMCCAPGRADGFQRVSVGPPLLATESDVERVAEAVLRHQPRGRMPEDALLLMGHGTWHAGDSVYDRLSERLADSDPLVFIGTMEGTQTMDQILPRLLDADVRRVWLMPLLAVAGRHVVRDMAGDQPDSWKSRLQAAGLECRTVLEGTAEHEGFVDVWLDHLRGAMDRLNAG